MWVHYELAENSAAPTRRRTAVDGPRSRVKYSIRGIFTAATKWGLIVSIIGFVTVFAGFIFLCQVFGGPVPIAGGGDGAEGVFEFVFAFASAVGFVGGMIGIVFGMSKATATVQDYQS